jgi:hypothetical protein
VAISDVGRCARSIPATCKNAVNGLDHDDPDDWTTRLKRQSITRAGLQRLWTIQIDKQVSRRQDSLHLVLERCDVEE